MKDYKYDYISIGIIGRNEGGVIANTLYYLLQQSYPLEFLEIIFVDGDSSDNTVIEVEKSLKGKINYTIINERTLENPKGVNYGHSRARNVAIMHMNSKSKYMAWIDADCRADKNWLMELWKKIITAKENEVGVGGPRYVETLGNIPTRELVLNYYFTSSIMSLGNPAYCERKIKYMSSIAGYNSIYKREILEKYRYDTTYPFNSDDIEINYRLQSLGFKFLYSSKAKIYHRLDETISEFLRHLYVYGNGAMNVSRLHKKIVRPYIPISILYFLYIVLLPLWAWVSQLIFKTSSIAFIPLFLIFILSVAVFIENVLKAKTWKSLYVFFLVPSHIFMYGLGCISNVLKKIANYNR